MFISVHNNANSLLLCGILVLNRDASLQGQSPQFPEFLQESAITKGLNSSFVAHQAWGSRQDIQGCPTDWSSGFLPPPLSTFDMRRGSAWLMLTCQWSNGWWGSQKKSEACAACAPGHLTLRFICHERLTHINSICCHLPPLSPTEGNCMSHSSAKRGASPESECSYKDNGHLQLLCWVAEKLVFNTGKRPIQYPLPHPRKADVGAQCFPTTLRCQTQSGIIHSKPTCSHWRSPHRISTLGYQGQREDTNVLSWLSAEAKHNSICKDGSTEKLRFEQYLRRLKTSHLRNAETCRAHAWNGRMKTFHPMVQCILKFWFISARLDPFEGHSDHCQHAWNCRNSSGLGVGPAEVLTEPGHAGWNSCNAMQSSTIHLQSLALRWKQRGKRCKVPSLV